MKTVKVSGISVDYKHVQIVRIGYAGRNAYCSRLHCQAIDLRIYINSPSSVRLAHQESSRHCGGRIETSVQVGERHKTKTSEDRAFRSLLFQANFGKARKAKVKNVSRLCIKQKDCSVITKINRENQIPTISSS